MQRFIDIEGELGKKDMGMVDGNKTEKVEVVELLCGFMAGHGEYMRNKQGKKRRQGVQLAGKRSGAEGPGFGIHCFIINNPGDIDPWLLVASLSKDGMFFF